MLVFGDERTQGTISTFAGAGRVLAGGAGGSSAAREAGRDRGRACRRAADLSRVRSERAAGGSGRAAKLATLGHDAVRDADYGCGASLGCPACGVKPCVNRGLFVRGARTSGATTHDPKNNTTNPMSNHPPISCHISLISRCAHLRNAPPHVDRTSHIILVRSGVEL